MVHRFKKEQKKQEDEMLEMHQRVFREGNTRKFSESNDMAAYNHRRSTANKLKFEGLRRRSTAHNLKQFLNES